MMLKAQKIVVVVAGLTTLVALFLVVQRGGLLAWVTFLIGAALLVKSWLKPAKNDLKMVGSLATLFGLAWVGTWGYVISTWESGEVAELAVSTDSTTHTARVWVLDMEASPRVYYDAPPDIAASLLAGTPVQFTRAGSVSTRLPRATPVDALPEAEANRVLEAMGAKYGDRNSAATLYFLMLGRARDRVALVVDLVEG